MHQTCVGRFVVVVVMVVIVSVPMVVPVSVCVCFVVAVTHFLELSEGVSGFKSQRLREQLKMM